jgi:hypothetical protein
MTPSKYFLSDFTSLMNRILIQTTVTIFCVSIRLKFELSYYLKTHFVVGG